MSESNYVRQLLCRTSMVCNSSQFEFNSIYNWKPIQLLKKYRHGDKRGSLIAMRAKTTLYTLEVRGHVKYSDAISSIGGSRNEIHAKSTQTLAVLAKLRPIWK